MTTFHVLVLFAAVALGIANGAYQLWVSRTGAVPEVLAQAEQATLLAAIRAAATEPRMKIVLSDFWRGRGWNRRQRYCLLRPLIRQHILHVAYAPDLPTHILQVLWFDWLAQPPNAVILNSRDWTRMATDASENVPSIIIGTISGGTNQIGGSHNNFTQQEVATEHMEALVQALRDDAHTDPAIHDDALNAASGIESELHAGRIGALVAWIGSASKLVNSSAATMDSTRKVLQALGAL